MSRTYLIFAEQRAGKLRQISAEALQAARAIGTQADRYIFAIIGSGVTAASRKLAAYDVQEVAAIDHPDLEAYNPEIYTSLAERLVDRYEPDVIVMGHTSQGRDLAPALAARLGVGLVSDVIAVDRAENEEVIFTRPIYAGKAFEQKVISTRPCIVTVRANNISAASLVEKEAPITAVPYEQMTSLRTFIDAVVSNLSGKVDLSEARVVVSGGRGVKSAEGFRILEELAAALGGAVGASRGACDAGYCDYALQIGQTGKVVTPDLYIACGISGAIQHLAGMSQSRVIVAINTDPEAPIFKIADYGIVGDLFTVVPMLTQAIRDRGG